MTHRAYTLDEIDQMRSALLYRFQFGVLPKDEERTGFFVGRPYARDEGMRQVEEELRTYMVAGLDPKEITG